MKHVDIVGVEICAGYRCYNGHVMTAAEAKAYNDFTARITDAEKNGWTDKSEFLKDQRFKLLMNICHNFFRGL